MNARSNASNLIRGLLAFAVLAHVAVNAVSAEPSKLLSEQQISVAYGDLNLTSSAGAETLYRRIKQAGARVCGAQPGSMELRRLVVWNECRETAIVNAVEAVGRPRLTALHRGKSIQPAGATAARTPIAAR